MLNIPYWSTGLVLLLTFGMSSCLSPSQRETQSFEWQDLRPLQPKYFLKHHKAFRTLQRAAALQLIKRQPPIPEPDNLVVHRK